MPLRQPRWPGKSKRSDSRKRSTARLVFRSSFVLSQILNYEKRKKNSREKKWTNETNLSGSLNHRSFSLIDKTTRREWTVFHNFSTICQSVAVREKRTILWDLQTVVREQKRRNTRNFDRDLFIKNCQPIEFFSSFWFSKIQRIIMLYSCATVTLIYVVTKKMMNFKCDQMARRSSRCATVS